MPIPDEQQLSDQVAETVKGRKPFQFDITLGKDMDQLRSDYLRCLRIAGHWQSMSMRLVNAMGDDAMTVVGRLPEPYKTDMLNLIEAYKD